MKRALEEVNHGDGGLLRSKPMPALASTSTSPSLSMSISMSVPADDGNSVASTTSNSSHVPVDPVLSNTTANPAEANDQQATNEHANYKQAERSCSYQHEYEYEHELESSMPKMVSPSSSASPSPCISIFQFPPSFCPSSTDDYRNHQHSSTEGSDAESGRDDASRETLLAAYYKHTGTRGQRTGQRRKRQRNDEQMMDGEQLLANELNELSLDEREKVYDEIHGVSEAVEETEELVETRMAELERQITTIHKKDAYSKVAFLSPRAVQDRRLRLKVLRKTKWVPREAAKLIVKYFEAKTNIYGAEKAAQPVRYQDLPSDARRSLECGAIIRHDNCVDLSGRSILIFNFTRFFFKSGLSLVQALWYMNTNSPQQLTQTGQKGLVLILNTVGATTADVMQKMKQTKSIKELGISDALPVKLSSLHICCENNGMKPLANVMLVALPKEMRLRTKIHFGSHIECLYELRSYGIPTKLLQLDLDGNPDQDKMMAYLQRTQDVEAAFYKEYEEALPSQDCIHFPSAKDVVLGRGWPFQSHTGNIRFMEFLESRKSEYDAISSRSDKTSFSTARVQELKDQGVRFLKRDDGTGLFWTQVTNTAARQKIAMSLRNLSRR